MRWWTFGVNPFPKYNKKIDYDFSRTSIFSSRTKCNY